MKEKPISLKEAKLNSFHKKLEKSNINSKLPGTKTLDDYLDITVREIRKASLDDKNSVEIEYDFGEGGPDFCTQCFDLIREYVGIQGLTAIRHQPKNEKTGIVVDNSQTYYW